MFPHRRLNKAHPESPHTPLSNAHDEAGGEVFPIEAERFRGNQLLAVLLHGVRLMTLVWR